METEIIVALIGASAVVIGAIIAAISKRGQKKPDSDRSSNSTVIGNDNITVIGDNNTITAEPKERESILAFAAQNVDPNYVLNHIICYL